MSANVPPKDLDPYLRVINDAIRQLARSTRMPLYLIWPELSPVPNGREYTRRQRSRMKRR